SVRYDYVNGYADVETAANTYGVDPTSEAVIDGTQYFTRGYITVKKETYNNAGFDVHPFRKAGWQYLRTERFDLELIEPAETLIGEALTSKLKFFLDIVGDIPDFIGYYNACATKGYCSKIELSNGSGFDAKPSFLRLKVTDYKKTGGGHRVNKITWSDNFAEGPQTLGKIYEYVTVDGKSSGVATSEPMEGKEDNTLSFPRYYLADPNSIYKHDQNFVEGPVNEAYFPVPSVGYSRVVVKNIPYTENIPGTGTPDDVTHNNNGIDVYEFYTAKDFPVYSTSTNISHAGYNDFTIKIPKGYDAYQYNGYSQGFYCELNDMHGKPRSEATYKTGADLSSLATAPIHKREYKYFTNSNGTLLNTVPCLTADGITENVLMGEDYEYFIEQKEHQSSITTIGKAANTDGLLGLPIPTLFPIENSESDIFRSTATNKIVHRKGILKEIVENNEGEITRTTNLYFDALTGDALLTKVNNSFNKPVYNYNYAGHWYYNGMKPASDNTGALIYMADASSGNISLTNAWQYVYEGDQLMITANGSGNFPNGTLLYVNNVDQNDFDVEDVDGIAPATLADVTLKVMKSAHSNLQSVACGNIESLQDPVANNSNVFVMFNKLVSGVVNDDNYSMPNVLTCASGEGDNYYRTASINVTSTYLEILSAGEGECEIQINFPATLGRSPLLKEFKFLSFSVESGVMQVQDLVTGDVMTCTLSGPYAASWAICWKPCFTVLNAGAAEFHNNSWSYDYDDVGDPVMKKRTVNGGTTHTVSTTGSDFHYGKKGIYRVKKNYAYQVARQQSYTSLGDAKTKIGIDGEFDEFTPFDWVTGGNSHWTWAQEMTRVSPYGTTLETTDRSGIYAATLVGYDNKTVTAQAANSSYFETAFDAFEDHGGTYGFRGHFELKLDDNSAQTISTTQAHTGTTSAVLSATKKSVHNFTGVAGGSLPTGNYFRAVENKKYLASGWFHLSDHTHVPNIKVKDVTTGTYITPFVTYNDYPAIENWKKMEIGFEITDDTHQYRIEYYIMNSTNTTQQSGYLDDIRVQPFESAMVSMVYDPLTLWKIAELDNQNFATFYNYDEEGNVVQVKKETVNGVVTIGTSRSSLNRQ
ncbi:MAG TPA: hypothetical protein VD905_17760, partial [Flavobacteriales bacterium]|nr:hypothetical protein [Flavobacteriales bacterium]